MKKSLQEKLIPFKQSFYNSCFVASFLMISGLSKRAEKSRKIEKEIFVKGERKQFNFWIQSMLANISKYSERKICLVVDNNYFAKILSEGLKNISGVEINQEKISISLINRLMENYRVAINLDNNNLGDYAHAPHWVAIEKTDGVKFTLVDPNTGGRRIFSREKLEKAIFSLKNHLKICPLLIYLK